MAKKQTFGDKTKNSSASSTNIIKLIKTEKSSSGFLRFKEEMIAIADGKNVDSVVKDLLTK